MGGLGFSTQRRPVAGLCHGWVGGFVCRLPWSLDEDMLSTCDSLGLLEPPVSMELCHLHFRLEWSNPGTRGCFLPKVPSKASGLLRILWRFSLTTNLLPSLLS